MSGSSQTLAFIGNSVRKTLVTGSPKVKCYLVAEKSDAFYYQHQMELSLGRRGPSCYTRGADPRDPGSQAS